MRFDPQSNQVVPGAESVPDAPPAVPAGIRTPVAPALALVAAVLMVGAAAWWWYQDPVTPSRPTPVHPSPRVTVATAHLGDISASARRLDDLGPVRGDGPATAPDRRGRRAARKAYLEGKSLVAHGQIDTGITHLREAIRLDPAFADAHYSLGLALVRSGDRAGAAAEHAVLADIDPSLANLLGNLLP